MKSKLVSRSRKVFIAARSRFLDRRPKLAYVGGWLGQKNLGDEALYAACQLLLPDFELIHYDGGRFTHEVLKREKRLKGGILGGGTLIGQNGCWLEILRRFDDLEVPMCVMGTGVANQHFWRGEPPLEEWIPFLERAALLGVRGPVSKRFLEDGGLQKEVSICGDPVLAFASDQRSSYDGRNRLGLNIGTADGRMWGSEERLLQEVATLARLAQDEGWEIHLFVVWPKDRAITTELTSRLGEPCVFHEHFENHEEFMREAARMSVFVGMKLHATVLCACSGTPVIMLEYRSKCRDFMESIDRAADCLRTDEVSGEDLWDRVQQKHARRDEEAEGLVSRVREAQRMQVDFANRIQKFFLGKGVA